MKKMRFNILLAMLTVALSSWADVTFALLNPRTPIQGAKFSITFRLTNGSTSSISAPEIPNCKLLYGPSTSTMSSTQIINGQMSSTQTIDYTFTYLAEKEGSVTIPTVTVSVSGKSLSSKPYNLKILPPDSNPVNSPAQGSNQGGSSSKPSTTATSKISADDMFVRISLNRSSVYEQEAIVVSVKVYTRYEISAFQITSQPTFEGFLSEELDVPQGTEMEHYNGKNYYTAYLKKCIVYPQKAGQLTITSGKYDVTVVDYELVSNGFFQTRRPIEKRVITESNTAKVNVTALPTAPAGFTGAVGDFKASVEMKPLELRTNEAASYIYKVEGTGNIKYLKTPTIDLPAGFDQYTPKTDINARFTGSDMRGTYTVNFTLVPQEPGKFEIDPTKFVYFNPHDKKYHTIDLQGFDVKVAQGTATSAVTEQKTIAKGMTDILHIKPVGTNLTQNPTRVLLSGMYWLLYAAAAMLLIIIFYIYRRQLKLNADVKGRKLARANKKATKRLRQAKAAMNAKDTDKFYAELNRAMWGYISDKLDIPSSQLLRENIEQSLLELGCTEEEVHETIDILDQCEMARFTPHTEAQMSQLYDQAVATINQIESTKK